MSDRLHSLSFQSIDKLDIFEVIRYFELSHDFHCDLHFLVVETQLSATKEVMA